MIRELFDVNPTVEWTRTEAVTTALLASRIPAEDVPTTLVELFRRARVEAADAMPPHEWDDRHEQHQLAARTAARLIEHIRAWPQRPDPPGTTPHA